MAAIWADDIVINKNKYWEKHKPRYEVDHYYSTKYLTIIMNNDILRSLCMTFFLFKVITG